MPEDNKDPLQSHDDDHEQQHVSVTPSDPLFDPLDAAGSLSAPTQSSTSHPLDLPFKVPYTAQHDPEATPLARPSGFPTSSSRAVPARTKSKNTTSSIANLRARVCRAAATGDLDTLISLLHPESNNDAEEDDPDYPSSFALVNSPTSSGLTPLLEAASHGHLSIVRHLLEEEGAVRDLEDVEGENAFLKAAYRGHLDIMQYLHNDDGEGERTDVDCKDRDGWNALHTAAGKGYLEIVMWLSENGAEIDAKSRQGYTPLMNASSKGHLPIVRYLLARHSPDPFIRNVYSETAYDVAVATFELGIADIISSYEAKVWSERFPSEEGHPVYNPLETHLTVPVVLVENQRLDLRWQTRAKRTLLSTAATVAGGTSTPPVAAVPRFTADALSRRDGHASYELPPSWEGINPSGRWIPIRKTEIHLPTLSTPGRLPLPQRVMRPVTSMSRKSSQVQTPTAASAAMSPSTSSSSSILSPLTPSQPSSSTSTTPSSSTAVAAVAGSKEPAWYFLSPSFFIDLSPSYIDPEQGWQYASSFSPPEEEWTAEVPEQVLRILGGEVPSGRNVKWVRRRRWARVMRRRLDVEDWGFADVKLQQAQRQRDSGVTDEEAISGDDNVDGLGSDLPPKAGQSYLERARYFAGSHPASKRGKRSSRQPLSEKEGALSNDDSSSVHSVQTIIGGPASLGDLDRPTARRIIARLERAIAELEEGLREDDNEGRKTEAWELKRVFAERLEELREEWPALRDSSSSSSSENDEEEAFRYPGADSSSDDDSASVSTSLRSASLYSPRSSPPQASLSFRRTSSQAGSGIAIPPLSGIASPPSRQLAFAPPAHPRPELASISQLVSSNPDFRVPTDEAPRQPLPQRHDRPFSGLAALNAATASTGWESGRLQRSSVPWERDEVAHECRRCSKRFSFFLRKHHCRKCGLVCCASCSSHQDYLRSSEVVNEPSQTGLTEPFAMLALLEGGGYFRTCDVCHASLVAGQSNSNPALLFGADALLQSNNVGRGDNALGTAFAQNNNANGGTSPMQRSISDVSELGECPVCGTELGSLGEVSEQEKHIQTCLDSGSGSRVQDSRYLVFNLPESSPLVGSDCLICFESYDAGDQIGRLSCLCHFHKHCISNWLSRGKACPVHAR